MVTYGVWCVLFTEVFNALGTFIIVPIVPFQVMQMGATPFQVSLLLPALFVTHMLASCLVGPAAERIGRRQILLWSQVYQAIGVILLGMARSMPSLFGALMVNGAANGCGEPMALAYIMEDARSEEELSQSLTLHRLSRSMGALAGPMLGLMIKGHSFQFLTRCLACQNMVNFMLSFVFLYDRKSTREKEFPQTPSTLAGESPVSSRHGQQPMTVGSVVHDLAQLFQDPGRAVLLKCFFWSSLITSIYTGPEAVMLKDRFGFNQQNMLTIFLVGTMSCIVGAAIVQVLLHGTGRFPGISAYFMAVTGTALASLTSLPFLFSNAAWLPYGYSVLVTGFFNNMWSLGFLQLVNQRVPKSKMGSFIGLQTALGSAGATLGPPIGGAIYSLNGNSTIFVSTVIGTGSAFMFSFWLQAKPVEEDLPPGWNEIDEGGGDGTVGSLPILSRPIMSPAMVMTDKTYVTRLLMREYCFRFDPEIMEIYQLYHDAAIDVETGFVAKNFTVPGDSLVAPGIQVRRQGMDNLRRASVRSKTEMPIPKESEVDNRKP